MFGTAVHSPRLTILITLLMLGCNRGGRVDEINIEKIRIGMDTSAVKEIFAARPILNTDMHYAIKGTGETVYNGKYSFIYKFENNGGKRLEVYFDDSYKVVDKAIFEGNSH